LHTTKHTIINGDSRQMNELEDESVHLVITSPSYWQLKDYGTDNQIGFHDDYQTYINPPYNERKYSTMDAVTKLRLPI